MGIGRKMRRSKLAAPLAKQPGMMAIDLATDRFIVQNAIISKVEKQFAKSKDVLMDENWEQGYQEGIAEVLACMSRMLLNDWRKLLKRDTRLKIAYNCVTEYREKLGQPCELQLEAEAEFERQTGLKMTREVGRV